VNYAPDTRESNHAGIDGHAMREKISLADARAMFDATVRWRSFRGQTYLQVGWHGPDSCK
jgi:hypothetical protein